MNALFIALPALIIWGLIIPLLIHWVLIKNRNRL